MRSLLLVLTALLSLSAKPVQACSCLRPPEAPVALKEAGAVFVGKVTGIEREKDGLRVTMEVDRAWKGITAKSVIVKTASDSAMCGYNFEIGKSYLVYTHATKAADGKQPELATNICTRTCHIDQAADDLKAIGEGKKIADAK